MGNLSCDNPQGFGAQQAARSGTHAFMTQTASPVGGQDILSQNVAPAQGQWLPGRTVTFTGYTVQLDFGAGLDNDVSQLVLRFLDASNVPIGGFTFSTSLVPGASWTQQQVQAVAPPGATQIQVTAVCTNTAGGLTDSYCSLAWDDFTLEVDQALPVELVAFAGVASGTSARLTWTTASETNNLGFVVEQQTGETWVERGFVAGHGTTTERHDYAFAVEGLTAGTHTFRIRQTDTDGAVHASAPTTVEIAAEGGLALTWLGGHGLRVESDADADVVAVDMLGRRVLTERVGAGTTVLPLDGVAPGVYVVRAEAHGRIVTTRLVVR